MELWRPPGQLLYMVPMKRMLDKRGLLPRRLAQNRRESLHLRPQNGLIIAVRISGFRWAVVMPYVLQTFHKLNPVGLRPTLTQTGESNSVSACHG